MTIWQRINLVQVHLELDKDLKKQVKTLWCRFYTHINISNIGIKIRALLGGFTPNTIIINV
jgi:hypothetical protein